MDLRATYDLIARDWFNDHNNDTWWVPGTERFLAMLKPNSSIIDIGCGAGVKTLYLMEKGHNVLGLDFSEELISIARENTPNGVFVVQDITEPLKFDGLVDGLFAQAVLLHIPKNKILNVLRNLFLALKQDGLLYLAVKEQRPGQTEEEIVVEDDYGYLYQRFFSYYTVSELKAYFHRLGMEVVHHNVTRSGKTNWIQMIVKNKGE